MRKSLRQFIAECLLVSEKQDLYGVKKCTGFSLVHMRGGQEIELKTIKIGSRQWEPKELAELFESTAETFAGGVPGTQQFQVMAFYDDQERPQSFYPFRKACDPDHEGITTEAPTPTGQLSQFMRHLEAKERMTSQYTVSIFSILERTIKTQADRISMLEREQFDAVDLAKEMILKNATENHDREVNLLKAKQNASDREKIVALLPAVANRVFGKEVFPQSVADSSLFENLAGTLTEKQVQQLSQVLTPEQWGLVAARLVDHLDKKASREPPAKEAKAKNGTTRADEK